MTVEQSVTVPELLAVCDVCFWNGKNVVLKRPGGDPCHECGSWAARHTRLSQPQDAPPVRDVDTLQPDGRHVVVPIEPTPEMIRAAWLVCRANFSESEYNIAIYRAMIQAALQSDTATIATLSHSPRPAGTEAEDLRRLVVGYSDAVAVMNAAMQDGINVHGALAAVSGYEDQIEEIRRALTPQTTGEKDKL